MRCVASVDEVAGQPLSPMVTSEQLDQLLRRHFAGTKRRRNGLDPSKSALSYLSASDAFNAASMSQIELAGLLRGVPRAELTAAMECERQRRQAERQPAKIDMWMVRGVIVF
jgi:hypothetical protein